MPPMSSVAPVARATVRRAETYRRITGNYSATFRGLSEPCRSPRLNALGRPEVAPAPRLARRPWGIGTLLSTVRG